MPERIGNRDLDLDKATLLEVIEASGESGMIGGAGEQHDQPMSSILFEENIGADITPGVGEIRSLVQLRDAIERGDVTDSLLSAAGAIPLVGPLAKGAVLTAKTLMAVDPNLIAGAAGVIRMTGKKNLSDPTFSPVDDFNPPKRPGNPLEDVAFSKRGLPFAVVEDLHKRPGFTEWYGASVLRAEDGVPLVLFRGTGGKDFNFFQSMHSATDQLGTHAGTPEAAINFTLRRQVNSNIFLPKGRPPQVEDVFKWTSADYAKYIDEVFKDVPEGMLFQARLDINRRYGGLWSVEARELAKISELITPEAMLTPIHRMNNPRLVEFLSLHRSSEPGGGTLLGRFIDNSTFTNTFDDISRGIVTKNVAFGYELAREARKILTEWGSDTPSELVAGLTRLADMEIPFKKQFDSLMKQWKGDFHTMHIQKQGSLTVPLVGRAENPLYVPDSTGGWTDTDTFVDAFNLRARADKNTDWRRIADHFKERAEDLRGMDPDHRAFVLRELLDSYGIDSIKYINQVEDPGSMSYIFWRPDSLKALHSPSFTKNDIRINEQRDFTVDELDKIRSLKGFHHD